MKYLLLNTMLLITLSHSEMINSYELPPEPDPKINNSTLLGIDVNNNGIRDDVERLIIIEEAKNPKFPKTHTAISLQYAWAWQKVLLAPKIESRSYLENHSSCKRYFKQKHTSNMRFVDILKWKKENKTILGVKLEEQIFNTELRLKRSFEFNEASSGNIFDLPKAEVGACSTNIDELGE